MKTLRRFPKIPGSFRLWLFIALGLSAVFGFAEVVDDVFDDPLEGDLETREFDHSILNFLAQFRTPHLNQAMTDFTALGSVSVIGVLALLLLAFMYTRKDFLAMIHLGIALTGALIWPQILKLLFSRTRPDVIEHLVQVTDLSFPSGHAFGAVAAYSTFAFFGARYMSHFKHEVFCYVFALVIVVLVGFSRVFLGVHYPTDVLAGACAGGVWAATLAAAFTLLYSRYDKRYAVPFP